MQYDENNFPGTYNTEPVNEDVPVAPANQLPPCTPTAQQEYTPTPNPFYAEPRQPVVPPAPPAPEKKKKKQRKPVGLGVTIAIALCCSLVGGVIGAVAMRQQPQSTPQGSSENSSGTAFLEGERESTVIDINKIDTSKVMTPAEVYATNVNSTVGITTSITTNFWGYQTTSAASGSGFIISKDGYILTNHHVIEDSSSITVSFYDGTSKEATLIGYDASNDIAVLKVEATNLVPVVLGDSNNLNVGDTVVAIGNPLGELTFSLTAGTISALEREVTISSGTTMRLMQTDCAINSGNSGGALFNLYGEVIGITNAKYSGNSSSGASIDNIAFAIPLNSVRGIVESLIEKGYISKPYIGVSIQDVSEESQGYGLPQGASVKSIEAGSPAETAGLQVNDIVTKIDDTEITGSSDLKNYISQCDIGQVLTLSVYRQGQTLELQLTIGEKIQEAVEQTPSQDQQQTIPDSLFPFWNFGF